MFRNKKATELRNKIQIHIAFLNSEIRTKKNFRANQITSLKNKYNMRSGDLTLQFENIIRADICIEKATQTNNYLRILFLNCELLIEKKQLPDDVQNALEICYYFAKINNQKDLYSLLSELAITHTFKRRPYATHETKVLFNSEQVTIDDAKKFYPLIKRECLLQEDEYLVNALFKYKDAFQSYVNNNEIRSSTSSLENIPNQFSSQNSLHCSQTFEMPLQYTPNGTQQIHMSQQDLGQLPLFSPNGTQQLYSSQQSFSQLPQITPNGLKQIHFSHPNLNQPPQFTPQILSEPPQFTPTDYEQPSVTRSDVSVQSTEFVQYPVLTIPEVVNDED